MYNFIKRFYKQTQRLKGKDNLDLIDAKNAMTQAVYFYPLLAEECAGPLRQANTLREIVDCVSVRDKKFQNLYFNKYTKNSERKLYTLDKETRDRYGSAAEAKKEC